MALAALSAGKVVALAVAGNVLMVGLLSVAVFPVQTADAVRDATSGLPAPLSGPVTGVFDYFAQEAVRGDNARIIHVPMQVESDPPTGVWSSLDQGRLSWDTLGGSVAYRWVVSSSPQAPSNASGFPGSVTGGEVAVPLVEGENWVHFLPTFEGEAGRVSTVGPLRSDPSPPPVPRLGPLGSEQVETYHFSIQWASVSDVSGIDAYVVYKSLSASGPFVPYKEVPRNELTERNQLPGDYYYRVAARNGAGLESEASDPLRVSVDPRTRLDPPPAGRFDYGVNAVYDSLLQVWDISDPSEYATLGQVPTGVASEYLGAGWGIEVDDPELVALTRSVVGEERNTLRIGMRLFELLFNRTDYDYSKFQSTESNFQTASETLERGLGICGDLTALYVTLMRIAGVPARPVHGYLINSGAEGTVDQGSFQPIGGFHMWAEIWVGGNQPGGPWLPVDVSGVTGDKAVYSNGESDFTPDRLDLYFGIYNPEYLQLDVQRDLGSAQGGNGLADRWNVWATLNWNFYSPQQGDPVVTFQADGEVTDLGGEDAYVFFTSDHRRVVTTTDRPNLDGEFNRYFQVKAQARKAIDYGANVDTGDPRVCEMTLLMKFPSDPSASQAVLYTTYAQGQAVEAKEAALGFLEWQIPGPGASSTPCQS